MLRPGADEPLYLPPQNSVIGLGITNEDDAVQDTVALEAGDRLFLFTVADGVLETIRRFQHGPDTDDQALIVAEVR